MHAAPAPSAATDPSALCASVQRLCSSAAFQLQQLEERGAGGGGGGGGGGNEDEARAGLTRDLNAAFGELARLDRALADGHAGARADYFAAKAASLRKDAGALRVAVERFLRGAFAARRELAQREQLFGGSGGGATDSVAVDAFIGERRALQSSSGMVDELAAFGEGVLASLREQRGMLKGAHRRVLDVGATLGLSSTLMRVIERRTAGDRIIVYGGMGVVLLLLGLAVWLTR
jgi:hypothetical protein